MDAYAAYLARPAGHRAIEGIEREPVPEAFAHARIAALTSGG